MSRHFHRDVENLHRQILSLSAQVEEMIDRAGKALCEGEFQQAEQVIQADDRIDQREVQIEEECLKMLALHQPVAIDLRRIATVLKINNDLERIADLAVNIAERAQALHERPDFPIPSKLDRMFRAATDMVRGALRAYVNCDAQAAMQICQNDDDVDQLNRDIIADLVELMQRKPPFVAPGLHCFSAVRHLERIADHAVSMAEDVVYLVSGEIVRHRRQM
jgi:phosphate transport system protein